MDSNNVRIIPSWWGGYLVQWRSDYLSFWHTGERYRTLKEATKGRTALLQANGALDARETDNAE